MATYAWAARDAASVTVRGVFGGRDGSKRTPRYNTQLQLQAAYVRRVGSIDASAFAGASVHVGDGDGGLLHAYPQLSREPVVSFRDAAYAGLAIDWH